MISFRLSKDSFIAYTVILVTLVGLYYTSWVNYLLFHSLAEIFSIVVAFSVFVITWNSRQIIQNQYLFFIGTAYLFIGFLDLLHTLSYKGMPIFTDYDYYANQLWIGARYFEAICLLIAFYFLQKKVKIRPHLLFLLFTLVTVFIVLSVFVWKIFPICFIAGEGLTPFKVNSEYIICSMLVVCFILLKRNKSAFDSHVYALLQWAMACTIVAELAFTFYISNYGLSNLVGHYFKIFSYFSVYLAIVKTGIEDPYQIIFRELNEEIEHRKKTEQELKNAMAEIKTLRGILPVCSYCKNIRDDHGYWNQIEAYITKYSDAEFSHSICPDCLRIHHPAVYEEIATGDQNG